MRFFDLLFKKNRSSLQSQNSGEFSSLFFENTEAIFVLDLNGQIEKINNRLKELLGYTLKDIKKCIPEEKHKILEYHFHKASNGFTTNFDMSLIHKEGHYIPVNINMIPSMKDDRTTYIIGICKDLSIIESYENKIQKLLNELENTQRVTRVGSWDYDVVKKKAYWSNETYKIFGVDNIHFVPTGEFILQLIHPLDRDRYVHELKKAIHLCEGITIEYRIKRMDREERTVLLKADVILNEEGQVIRLIGTVQDITENKTIQVKLLESEQQFHSISDHLPVGIWSYDKLKNKIVFCSKGVEEIYGVDAEKFMEDASLWMKFVHPEDVSAVEENQQKLINGEKLYHQYRIINANGKVKWLSDQTLPYLDLDGNVIRLDGIVKDITEEKEYTEALSFLTDHDQLTRLPNRRYFQRYLDELIHNSKNNGKQFAVFCLGLDRFKYINETLGYDVGDQLLVHFSKRLNQVLGQNVFLARFGGDEFAMVVNDIDNIEEALQTANQIIDEMKLPFYLNQYELYTSTSIGISYFPFDGEDSNTLLKNAEIALHKTKEICRNDWQVYSSTMNIESYKLFELEKDLRKANMDKEFFLLFQLKVNANTGEIVGVEALVRWKNHEWGIVSPQEFIPLAEDNGMIIKIEDWVLEEVCQMQKKWNEEGLPMIPVSINISPIRILKSDFVEKVRNIVESANIDPKLIEIELTESSLLKNIEVVKRNIAELRSFGITFALDDFGTGYSSFSHIKNLDIHTIKVEKTFIDELTSNKVSEGIIKSLIYLAKELGIQVVAAGVETKEQLDLLIQHGCTTVQGYIFSRPVDESDFVKLLNKGTILLDQNNAVEGVIEDKRKFYRLSFKNPLCAEMTIIKFKNKEIKLGKSRSIIEDISLGGLKYLTNIDLPVQKDMALQFTTTILGEEIQLVGCNVWKREVDELFQYGFEFIVNENEHDRFAALLNQLTVKLKQGSHSLDCSFLQGNKVDYLKG